MEIMVEYWVANIETLRSPGFGLLESGYVNRKNEVNIMVKNAVDVIFGGLGYWMFGYAFSFGEEPGSNFFIVIKNSAKKIYETYLNKQICDILEGDTEGDSISPETACIFWSCLQAGNRERLPYGSPTQTKTLTKLCFVRENSLMNGEHMGISPVVSRNIYGRYCRAREQLQALQSD
ncbi:hypothetical protein TNCV_3049311 [Trichonephila clavipes]|nr:hypothetical protein TNCV_3049311 [Trichonephila clavipes]